MRKIIITVIDRDSNVSSTEEVHFDTLKEIYLGSGINGVMDASNRLNEEVNRRSTNKIKFMDIFSGRSAQENLKIGKFTLDPALCTLSLDGVSKKLSTKQTGILRILAEYTNEVVEASVIMKAVWGNDSHNIKRSMDVYITQLRKILSADTDIKLMNVHGIGNKLTINNNGAA